ncbi:MAG: bile acid:sodium symporter family protein [Pseudomonadales bacterium]
MLNRFNSLFPLWAVLLSLLAYNVPSIFSGFSGAIIPLLSMIMFFMGLTLTAQDFKRVLIAPKPIAIGAFLQFLIMPLVAFLISRILSLPDQISAGLILVGCVAGGTASNVICYLARANVALSITMTMVSTLLGVVLTPLLCWLYISESIDVEYMPIFISILKMVIAPVLSGVFLNHFFRSYIQRIEVALPTLSILSIVFIIAIIVALNQQTLVQVGALTFVAVALHNGIGMAGAYTISRFLKVSITDSRTIAIEVGMQNSGLGVALALKYFSPLAALPGALFSIWHNVVGSILASYWKATADKYSGDV